MMTMASFVYFTISEKMERMIFVFVLASFSRSGVSPGRIEGPAVMTINAASRQSSYVPVWILMFVQYGEDIAWLVSSASPRARFMSRSMRAISEAS